jgi:hypothetical protein
MMPPLPRAIVTIGLLGPIATAILQEIRKVIPWKTQQEGSYQSFLARATGFCGKGPAGSCRFG